MDVARFPRPTPGQLALADALARGEASLGTEVQTLPASVYTDPDRFEAEKAALFQKLPLLLAPSALLPRNNLAVAHDGYGVPLILSRDAQAEAHVMANVCRHRGTRLLDSTSDDAVPAARIVCPYHAWTYRSDGSLLGLPRADCFPGMDKDAHALMRFRDFECGGLIWYSHDASEDFARDRNAVPGFRRLRGRIAPSLQAQDAPRRGQLETGDRRLPRNPTMSSDCTRPPSPISSPTELPRPIASATTSAPRSVVPITSPRSTATIGPRFAAPSPTPTRYSPIRWSSSAPTTSIS